ncbi:hypothetical protein TrLO_g15300 [Triparma laevis f. longispina]|uniref:Calpain catalytic domain-containing protein n=1 Tax=Triparma laevis f. longispina TaxID=1714387 RepID=A0A9W7KVQ4_9STRA|nr:hypothetical protein TrLO_g15300 [Triparma laevis f. longispina]
MTNKQKAKDVAKDASYVLLIVARILLVPISFLYQGFHLYVFSCLHIYCTRCLGWCFKKIDGRLCRCVDLRYTDPQFPATSKSVDSDHPQGHFYAWMRAWDLHCTVNGADAAFLFADGVSVKDICQGGLGDCWLIAAIAALAEYPGLIQRIFVTKETNPLGRYTLRLFDIALGDDSGGGFVNVVVDDRIPTKCDGGYPRLMYMKMDEKEGEIWPLLVEKVLAKWAGSYKSLDGGHASWALATLTGWETESLIKTSQGRSWEKRCMMPKKSAPRDPHTISYESLHESFSQNELFELLKKYDEGDYIMCCSSHSGNDTVAESSGGIVQGHAYTLIGVHQIGEHRLMQCRNPWGSFEWTGKWSDKHQSWLDHREVFQKLNPSWEDDGIFYIGFEDFVKNYRKIDVCKRDVNVYTDLYLNVDENDGAIGPTKACVSGCGKYLTGEGCKLSHPFSPVRGEIDMRKRWFLRSIDWLVKDFKSIRVRRSMVVGARVELVNMGSRSEMNGKFGEIVEPPHDGEDDLVKVKLENRGRTVKVKQSQVLVKLVLAVGGGGAEPMEKII